MNTKIDTSVNYDRINEGYQNTHKRRIIGLIGKISAWQKTRKQYRADRAALKELLLFSDKDLNDIGISRADVVWAINLPRDQIATLELQKLARSQPADK